VTHTKHASIRPLVAALSHTDAMKLAATEYQRVLDLLRSLSPGQWTAATECPGWDVRAVAAHMLGMVEIAASLREQMRQVKAAQRAGGLFIDALTALQVEERADWTPDQIVDRFAKRWPKAAAGRRRTPGFVRSRRMGVPQLIGGREEVWTIGYLNDVILTRDPWMHRVDIARATGGEPVVSAEHDGVLVADVVADWAARHGRPYTLRLTGPAGGCWGSGGEEIEMDAIEFCRVISGRGGGAGLLATEVPF
jgi:uncharacterized protein (TIGR03083 family)